MPHYFMLRSRLWEWPEELLMAGGYALMAIFVVAVCRAIGR
jgi:hypothetical protein